MIAYYLIFDISFIEACYKKNYTNAIWEFADKTAEAMRVVKKITETLSGEELMQVVGSG